MNYKTIFLTVAILISAFVVTAHEQKEIDVQTFNQVKFEGSAQWELISSDEEKVIIESESTDVFDYVNVEQSGDILVISTTEKNKNIGKLFKSVTIKVYFKSISSVSLSGVGSVKTTGNISATELTATLRGTGNMHLNTQCSELIGNMYGTGALNINGTTDNAIVRVEGVGSFEGYELVTTVMDVTVSGVGAAYVFSTNKLTATLNGVGSIKYKGDPEFKNINTNGIGSIKKSKQ